MRHHETSYLNTDPLPAVEALEVSAITTAVVSFQDHPMDEMAAAFDSTFQALFPALAQVGINPVGPPFSLHHRAPTDTATFEVGIPVDRALANPVATDSGLTINASTLPAGRIARISHLGSYEELGRAWESFLQTVAASGNQLTLPFWEVYITEPSPEADPATMRTDLYTLLE